MEIDQAKFDASHGDRYRIIAKLAAGGMADIYLGVQLGEYAFERLVVIKKIPARGPNQQQLIHMFLNEARVIASLSHPHIVKVFDLSRLKKSICITMEYIDGESFSFIYKWLKKNNRHMPLPILCRFMVQACEALQYAHNAQTADGTPLNIIHRDIDLRNLMLDSNGYVKVIDFGVAKAATQTELTAPSMFKGKLNYVAPETFTRSEIDYRIDIYALGLVFYQMATGVAPYAFKTDVSLGEVIDRVCNEHLKPPSSIQPSLPSEIDALIGMAIEKDRDERINSAEAFADAIRSFANKNEGIANPDETKSWYRTVFESRIQQRRKFEQKVMQRARDLASRTSKSSSYTIDNTSILSGLSSFPTEGTANGSNSLPPTSHGTYTPVSDISNVRAGSSSHPYSSKPASTTPVPEHRPDDAALPVASDHQPHGAGSSSMPVPPHATPDQAAIPVPQLRDPSKRFKQLAIVIGAIVLLLGGIGAMFAFITRTPDPEEMHNLVMVSSPPNADVRIDGIHVGTTSDSGLRLWVIPDEPHIVKVSKDGYDPYEVTVEYKANESHHINAVLAKKTAASSQGDQDTASLKEPPSPSIAAAQLREPEAPDPRPKARTRAPRSNKPTYVAQYKRPDPEPANQGEDTVVSIPVPEEPPAEIEEKALPQKKARPAKRPRPKPKPRPEESAEEEKLEPVAPITTPRKPAPAADEKSKWYSGTGNWSGAKVIAKGCGRCHKVDYNAKTETQWEFFFRRKRHRRNGKLEDFFSKQELNRALSYILNQRSEEKKVGIAGVR